MNQINITSPEYDKSVSEKLRRVARAPKAVFEIPAPGTMAKVFEEARALFEPHWNEVAVHKQLRPLDIDTERFEEASNKGNFVGVCARVDGVVVGYAGYFLSRHPHYKTWIVAKCDVLFVHPEHRNIFIATGLLKKAEEYLRSLGVNSMVSGTKKHKDLESLFKFMGHEAIETLYEKVL